MLLALLRRSSRAVAACLVLVSLFGLPHRSQDDAACAPLGAESHDESKHVFTAADPVAHEDHCAICHWVRSLKPNFSATGTVRTHLLDGTAVGARAPGVRRDPAADRLPARAPPSVLQ